MAQPKDFGFGPDEVMLRDSVRRCLDESAPMAAVRRLVADHDAIDEGGTRVAAYDREVWRRMVELGWTALGVPEAAGGLGMKLVAVAALAEEIGRHALPSPLPATLAATLLLREAEAGRADPWLAKIAAGMSATVAVTDEDGSWDPDRTSVRADVDRAGAVLDGTAYFVQDARKAELFIVSAAAADGVGLFAVPADAPGVTIVPDAIVD
ncbi:MAG: acyl-CoA dehydrogenase family protein, partial [Candidatus Binatia bacterium]